MNDDVLAKIHICQAVWQKLGVNEQARLLSMGVSESSQDASAVHSVESSNELLERFLSASSENDTIDLDFARLFVAGQALASERLVDKIDDVNLFAQAMQEFSRENPEYNSSKLSKVIALVALNNLMGKSVCVLMARIASSNNKNVFWQLCGNVLDALPLFEMSIDDCIQGLDAIREMSKEDLTSWMVYQSAERLAQRQPDFCWSVVNQLMMTGDEAKSSFVPNLLSGIALAFGNAYVYGRAHSMACSEDVVAKKIGMATLSMLNYDDDKGLLDKSIEYFESVRDVEDPAIASQLVAACRSIMKYWPEAGDEIAHISRIRDPIVQFQIAVTCHNASDSGISHGWVGKCLMSLSVVSDDLKGIIDRVDYSLHSLSKVDTALSFEFLEAWVLSRDYMFIGKFDIAELFDLFFAEAARENKGALQALLVKWFNSDDDRLNVAAAHVVRRFSPLEGDERLELDPKALNRLSDVDIEYLSTKILALVYDGRSLCSLIFSILLRDSCSTHAQNVVMAIFRDRVFYNFPEVTIEFLDGKKSGHGKVGRSIARRLFKEFSLSWNAFCELPRMQEFAPPVTRSLYFRYMQQHERNKSISEGVYESSIFMRLATSVPLKGGASFIMDGEGGATSTPLVSMSVKADLPRGELIDSLGELLLRMQWRQAKRGGKP